MENRIEIGMSHYLYLSKESIPDNVIGFSTSNVCECVCGIISSDQGHGFFHYYRADNPYDLTNKIKRDFKNSTSLKITLIGGNPADLSLGILLPWKEKNRELKFFSDDGQIQLTGSEAIDLLQQNVLTNPTNTKYFLREKNIRDFFTHSQHRSCKKNFMKDKNIFLYDYRVLDNILAEKRFEVRSFDKHSTFKVTGVKDVVGYQNLAKVINALTEDPELFTEKNIKHYNCPQGNGVIADFNGDFRSIYPLKKGLTFSCEKIAEATTILKNRSIKNKALIGFQSDKRDIK